jgi:hypothetical protein
MSTTLPNFLTHYYEAKNGPFRSLSDLSVAAAESVMADIREKGNCFASRRAENYLDIRRELEEKIRRLFLEKGGKPQRDRPHYFILGACAWVKSWYENGQACCIPLAEFSPDAVSFTYGDSFPAMRFQDGRPYRGKVYSLAELPALVQQYGLPQEWNHDGTKGPERYIEAQVWEDAPVRKVLSGR